MLRLKELIAGLAMVVGFLALLWAGMIQRLLHPSHTSTVNLFLNWREYLAGTLLLLLGVMFLRDSEKNNP